MSTATIATEGIILEDCSDVLVRSYGGQPLKLKAIRNRGDVIEVARDNPAQSIGHWPEDVFVFDDNLYYQLCASYDAEQMDEVASMWARAVLFQMEPSAP